MAANQNLANMFKMFAIAFRPPTLGAWTDAVVSGSLRAGLSSTWEALELPAGSLAEFSACLGGYVGHDPEEVLHELRIEETRLFVGEDPIVENAEGTWLQRANGVEKPIRMINSHTTAVMTFMRECGVVRNEKYNDCIDYLENECDFCGYLAETPELPAGMGDDPLILLDRFVAEHMAKWVPGFCDEVIAASKVPYYIGICTLMRTFIREF